MKTLKANLWLMLGLLLLVPELYRSYRTNGLVGLAIGVVGDAVLIGVTILVLLRMWRRAYAAALEEANRQSSLITTCPGPGNMKVYGDSRMVDVCGRCNEPMSEHRP